MSSPAKIAVVIVNYNTATLTIDCVDSILRSGQDGRDVEVYVVDNASPFGDASVLSAASIDRSWGDRVKIRLEKTNHGFGRGVNLVLQDFADSAPEYVFLLNPDACLVNDAVGILSDFLDAHPRAAAAGSRITSPAGNPVTAAFRFPGVVSTFSSALSFGPVSQLLKAWEVPLPPIISTQPVDWVSGAAVMMRLSEVQRVGLFDPAYFLYFEEVDLMRRLQGQGGEIWHVAEARVMHMEGASTGVKSGHPERRRLPAYWYESWRHYFAKNLGRGGALFAAAAWYMGAIGNTALAWLPGRSVQAPRQFYRDFWRVGVRPLLGLRPLPYE